MMGTLVGVFIELVDAVSAILFGLSSRQCVDCHLSHGLTPEEAGHCNNTCAPLVDYMDDESGTASLAKTSCSEYKFRHKNLHHLQICALGDFTKQLGWVCCWFFFIQRLCSIGAFSLSKRFILLFTISLKSNTRL